MEIDDMWDDDEDRRSFEMPSAPISVSQTSETAEGIDAWKHGIPYASCPYPAGIKQRHWRSGWTHMDRGYAADEGNTHAD